MTDVVQKLANSIQSFDQETDQMVMGIVKDNEGLVLEMNRNQMYSGKDGNGVEISPGYADSTIARKRRKGNPYDRVTLKDEGDFYRLLDLKVGNDSFLIQSNDTKSVYLERKYGDDIYGLDSESLTRLKGVIQEGLIEQLKSLLQ